MERLLFKQDGEETMGKKSKKENKKAEIKQDLLDQLERNGTVGKYYLDLVEDYIALWDTKNLLITDIKERGAVVTYTSNVGVENQKKNESVGELLKVNAQMLKILDGLGITPMQGESFDEDM